MHKPFLRAVPNARPNAVVIDDVQKDKERTPSQSITTTVVLLCVMAMVAIVSMWAAASVATILATHL